MRIRTFMSGFLGGMLGGLWLALVSISVVAGNAPPEESPAGWYADGERLISRRREQHGSSPARNLILFLGDGMSLATVTAARILEGQLNGRTGEENLLHFETFPHTALAKTYNTNQQIPDSAGTMTALVTGVKTFAGAIGVDQLARRNDCDSVAGHELVTLLDLAALAGMQTGVLTTTRITHATPASLFAKAADRGWEADADMPAGALEAGCRDIARQLVEYDLGGGIDVVFGGGRRAFRPAGAADPEYPDDPDKSGTRADGRDLIDEWRERRPDGRFVWHREQFDELEPGSPGPVLGLFEPDHMHYEHDRDHDGAGEPSLSRMTRRAIRILQSRDQGFLLVVEGGRIDLAHHVNNAHRALTETIEFARAVRAAGEMTDPENTLIVVTADHGHAMTFGGDTVRGNPVTGLVRRSGKDGPDPRLFRDPQGRPATALRYHDGPGYRGGERPDYDRDDPRDPDFVQEATVADRFSSHAGEDVPVYATGPGAEVLHGVVEQNVIFHAMLRAVPGMTELAERLKNDQGLPDWSERERVSGVEQKMENGK